MKSFTASAHIKASAETIWKILTDATGYPQWDPGVIRIEGMIAKGQTVTAYTKINPKRAFPAKVTEFVPGQRMTWVGGMPFGLFQGVRTFTLLPDGQGSIQFTLREDYGGPLLPLFAGSVPDLTQSFEDFANGLKTRAESQ